MKKPPDLARSSSTRTRWRWCSVLTMRPSVAKGMFIGWYLERKAWTAASRRATLPCCGQQVLHPWIPGLAQFIEEGFHRLGQRPLLRPACRHELRQATQLPVGEL